MSTIDAVDAVIIGAGQAGLAASRCLTDQGVDHVVLERGRVAERWRSERWDSLRLLTPNWMTRLPGWSYSGPDPHGFMTAAEVTAYFRAYADASAAPVVEDSAVVSVHRTDGGFGVTTTSNRWTANNVVIATGWCDEPAVPRSPAASIAASRRSRRRPTATPGRCPTGESWWWARRPPAYSSPTSSTTPAATWWSLSAATPACPVATEAWTFTGGSSGSAASTAPSTKSATLRRRAREPSVQIVGRPDHRNLDLTTLAAAGVGLAGRLTGIDGHHVGFAPDLAMNVAAADTRMRRVLADIDAHVSATGLTAEVLDPEPQATFSTADPPGTLDLRARRITSVIWATGFRRTYPWLHLPVLDARGEIHQHRGVTRVPGVYVLGQRFQHRRNSSFIDGVGRDAAFVAHHLAGHAASMTRC